MSEKVLGWSGMAIAVASAACAAWCITDGFYIIGILTLGNGLITGVNASHYI